MAGSRCGSLNLLMSLEAARNFGAGFVICLVGCYYFFLPKTTEVLAGAGAGISITARRKQSFAPVLVPSDGNYGA